MINVLVEMQIDSDADEIIEAANSALLKYGLLKDTDVSSDEISGKEKLQKLVENIERNTEDTAMVFDTECIENDEDYSNLAKSIFAYADEANRFSKVKSAFNYDKEKAGLAVSIDGVIDKKTWHQSSDYVSDEFLNFMNEILEKHFQKKMLILPTSDQCMRLIVVEAKDHASLEKVISFNSSHYTPRETYRARIASLYFVCPAGAILSTLAGWYFLGFLWALLASAIVWGLIGFALSVKYAWTCVQDEEFEELRKSDPIAYSKAIMAAFVEEAAKREGDSEMGKRLQKVAELNREKIE